MLEREDWAGWRDELPGRIRVQMAPRYWIWQDDGFTPEQGPARFAGFLSHLLQNFSSDKKTVPDMRGLMAKIELVVPTCREEDRTAMLVLYSLYHSMTGSLSSDSKKFLNDNAACLEACGIETLAVWPLFHTDDPPWPIDECVTAFENYLRKRHRPHALHLPLVFEIAIIAQIANRFLGSGVAESFVVWVDRSTFEAAGRRDLQDYLALCKRDARRIDPRVILGIVKPNGPPNPSPSGAVT